MASLSTTLQHSNSPSRQQNGLDGAPHCFMLRRSGWPNRDAGKGPAKGSLKRANALPSDWKTAANK